jgi:hypothetical protein
LYNDASYRSISMNSILLNRLFRKEYIYGLISSSFSRGEKQQAKSRTYWNSISRFEIQ